MAAATSVAGPVTGFISAAGGIPIPGGLIRRRAAITQVGMCNGVLAATGRTTRTPTCILAMTGATIGAAARTGD